MPQAKQSFPRPVASDSAAHASNHIIAETQWRQPEGLSVAFETGNADFIVSRWQCCDCGDGLHDTVIGGDYYTIALYLKRTNLDYWRKQQLVHSGRVVAGSIQVSSPGESARIFLREACDVLHLHINRNAMEECGAQGQYPGMPSSGFLTDGAIERLGHALLQAEQPIGFGRMYVQGLCVAIVTRLLGILSARCESVSTTAAAPLPAWRLRKATEFIDANLSETIKLAHVADAAGLTRMHFAAQFRAATGQRPHDYLLRRRIEKAQELLASSATPIAQVALEVGFQTQAHFASVFKRFAGETPSRWRCHARDMHTEVGGTQRGALTVP